jgi:hypothetical protein
MQIQCSDIIDLIRSDFGQLWDCRMVGKSLAVSTPYLLPNNNALTLYVTTRDSRIIVSDGGFSADFLNSHSELEQEKIDGCRDYFTEKHDVSRHEQAGRPEYFYKETTDVKLVPSLFFDLGNFVTAFCTAAVPFSNAEEAVETTFFSRRADNYIKGVVGGISDRHFQKKLEDIPSASFGAVISSHAFSRLWLVSYVTGSSSYVFNRNLSSAIVNFRFVRKSKLAERSSLITLVNNECAGYHPDAQTSYFSELMDTTEQEPVVWTLKEQIISSLEINGPKLTKWSAHPQG